LLVGALGDGAGAAADQALDVAPALRALVDRRVRHLLAFLKMASALIANVFVGWQEIFPQFLF
jgi:hypothetical protein